MRFVSARSGAAFVASTLAIILASLLVAALRDVSPRPALADTVVATASDRTANMHAGAPPQTSPRNDNSADAALVTGPSFEDDVDTTGATLEPGEPPACGSIGATVWYHLRAMQDARVRVTTEGTVFRSVLAAYETAAITPTGPTSRLGCAAGGPTLEFDVKAGKDYFVQAGGASGASGLLKFHLTCLTACPAAAPPVPTVVVPGPTVLVSQPTAALPEPTAAPAEPTATLPTPRTGVAGAVAGAITLPDTGSGGYLPGARQ